MTFFHHVYDIMIGMFPVGTSIVLQFLCQVFVIITLVNIILSIIWVINQVKSLFSIV